MGPASKPEKNICDTEGLGKSSFGESKYSTVDCDTHLDISDADLDQTSDAGCARKFLKLFQDGSPEAASRGEEYLFR